MKYIRLATLSLFIVVLISGCSLIGGTEVPATPEPDPNPEDPRVFLLNEGFEDSDVGALPTDWTEIKRAQGTIEVVSDDDFDSGKALRIMTNQVDSEDGVGQVRLDKILGSDGVGDAETIAIQFKLKWYSGSFNGYIREGEHLVDWSWGMDNVLRVRSSEVTALTPGELYTVRLVADRTTERISVYVDDMDSALVSDAKFRASVPHWEDKSLRFASSPKTDAVHETLIGDIEIWVVE